MIFNTCKSPLLKTLSKLIGKIISIWFLNVSINIIIAIIVIIKTKKILFKLEKFDKNISLSMPNIKFSIISNQYISVSYEKDTIDFENLISFLKKNNLKILDISIDDGDLEDVFLQLIKN